jgi:hypothetical protein
MNRRTMTLVPIVLGGAAGALLGVFEAFPTGSTEAVSAENKAQRGSPPAMTSTASTATTSVGAALGEPLPSGSAAPSLSSAPSREASPTSSAAVTPAAPLKRAFDLSEPGTADALLAAQVQCNRSVPEDCERAAAALESGSLGTKDPPRARSLRRIALTLYVKQCEAGRALACARLAEMYDVGDIVQTNPRNAEALRKRVRELCVQRPSEAGCSP